MSKNGKKIARRLVEVGEERGYRRGLKKGLKKGLREGLAQADEVARQVLVQWIRDVVEVRFKKDDPEIGTALAAVGDAEVLREVHRQALTAKTLAAFRRHVSSLAPK